LFVLLLAPAIGAGAAAITGATVSTGWRVSGRVTRDHACTVPLFGWGVILEPTGRQAETAADGTFVFEDVADGDYRLRLTPDCRPIPCYPSPTVTVAGQDASADLCPEACPRDGALVLSPEEGPAGTSVDALGRCQHIKDGRTGNLYFDGTFLTQVQGSSSGLYSARVRIPAGSSGGVHYIFLRTSTEEGNRAPFLVTEEPNGCIGDCDGNRVVLPPEVRWAIDAALGREAPAGCGGFDSNGDGRTTVQELVAVVNRFLGFCPPM
jgi:hypothetical protein